MMLLLAYIIVGHPDWKRAEIRLFVCSDSREGEREVDKLSALTQEGRLPISMQNVTSVSYDSKETLRGGGPHQPIPTGGLDYSGLNG